MNESKELEVTAFEKLKKSKKPVSFDLTSVDRNEFRLNRFDIQSSVLYIL